MNFGVLLDLKKNRTKKQNWVYYSLNLCQASKVGHKWNKRASSFPPPQTSSFFLRSLTRMPLKHSSPDPISSSDSIRLLSRETLRISASLAAPPDDLLPQALPDSSQFLRSTLRLICCEEIDGRRWKYVAESDGSGKFKRNSVVRAVSLESPRTPFDVRQVPIFELRFC